MALTVLDSSVLIAYLEPDDAQHENAKTALRAVQRDQLAIPSSVYAEILVGPFRAGSGAVERVDGVLEDFNVQVEPLTRGIARAAARLRARHRALRLPDAVVLATGDELEATRILTADADWTRFSRRARPIAGYRRK